MQVFTNGRDRGTALARPLTIRARDAGCPDAGMLATLTDQALPESFPGEQTTFEYFGVLGVPPALGRVFRPADDVPNAPRVVVLSHSLWLRHFSGDPAAVGRSIVINNEAHEIVGVMPASFRPALVTGALLWRPLRLNPPNPSRNA